MYPIFFIHSSVGRPNQSHQVVLLDMWSESKIRRQWCERARHPGDAGTRAPILLGGLWLPPSGYFSLSLLCRLVGFTSETPRSYPPEGCSPLPSPTRDLCFQTGASSSLWHQTQAHSPSWNSCSSRPEVLSGAGRTSERTESLFLGHRCDWTIPECSHSVCSVDYNKIFLFPEPRTVSGARLISNLSFSTFTLWNLRWVSRFLSAILYSSVRWEW